MENMVIEDTRLIHMFARFTEFVQYKNQGTGAAKEELISFRDSNGFLGREEDYKSGIAEDARKELHYKDWNENWIGTGKIAAFASKAMSKAGNLVNSNQQISFKNRLNRTRKEFKPEAEKALYSVYCGEDEEVAFEEAVKVFGAKYDLIAFLFFVKDDTRFLPISPGNFDNSFKSLGINYKTANSCSWQNYLGFISIIKKIQSYMDPELEKLNMVLPLKAPARLIDAHSFVWIIQEDQFLKWKPSAENEKRIEQKLSNDINETVEGSGKRKKIVAEVFERSAKVVKSAKARANGICQLCKNQAPFMDKNGTPYLEGHHVIWISRDGKDSTDNVVALCPNCHTKMHVLNDPIDIEILKDVLKNQ